MAGVVVVVVVVVDGFELVAAVDELFADGAFVALGLLALDPSPSDEFIAAAAAAAAALEALFARRNDECAAVGSIVEGTYQRCQCGRTRRDVECCCISARNQLRRRTPTRE